MKGKNDLKCKGINIPKKRQEGITLVALVITIIVLLILAGVTINVAIRTGLMSKSENAVDKYLDQERVEADRLDAIEKRMGELSGMKDNTEGTEHTKMIEVKPYSYKNPVIPAGFRTSSEGASWSVRNEEEVSGWNDGLVIEDGEGNQFVWVPVDGTNVTYDFHYNISSSIIEQGLPDGVTSEQYQITTYGGFYIGRYESGLPSSLATADSNSKNVSGTPVIKANQTVWDMISWTQAKANAKSMYTGSNVKSELITDKMWDTTCKWLENAGIDVKTDCKDWGNYSNAEVTGIKEYGPNGEVVNFTTKPANSQRFLKTGQTEYTKRKNIYDLAGGMYEWTNAKFINPIFRSGSWFHKSNEEPAIKRISQEDKAWSMVGFRVALFVQ